MKKPVSFLLIVVVSITASAQTIDLGVSNDYMNEKMPPVLTDMLNGHLA